MQLDTSIPLQSQTMSVQPAIQNYFQAKQLKTQQSLADLKLTTAEKERKKQLKLQEIMANATDASGRVNRNYVSSELNRNGFTKELNEIQTSWNKQDVAQTTKMDKEQAWIGNQSSTVLESKNPAENWPLMKTQAINRGVRGAESWPDQYGKGVEHQLNYMSLSNKMGKGRVSNIAGQVMYDENQHPWLLSKDPDNPFMKPYTVEGLETPKKFTPSKGFSVKTIGEDQFLINNGTGERTKLAKDAKIDLAKTGQTIKFAELGLKKSAELRAYEKWIAEQNRELVKKGKKKAGTDLAAKTVVQDMGRGMAVLEKNMKGLVTTAAGPLAWVTKNVPGTDADVLERYAESVKSNISIDRLQAMREASPTGGALGQVPVQQQEYLMQLLGSLDVTQKPPVLLDNMKRIYNIYMDAIHGVGNGPPRKSLSFNEEGVTVPGGVKWTGTEFLEVIKTPQQLRDLEEDEETQGINDNF